MKPILFQRAHRAGPDRGAKVILGAPAFDDRELFSRVIRSALSGFKSERHFGLISFICSVSMIQEFLVSFRDKLTERASRQENDRSGKQSQFTTVFSSLP